MLKNYKALENIRNTQVGHIQIDYRIACAMQNFCHKPCSSDGNKAYSVAKRLKERASLTNNSLECIMRKRIDSKLMPCIDLSEIDDFPKLNNKEIQERICFGSFQLKQSKSYMIDVIKQVRAFKLDKKNTSKISDKKLRDYVMQTDSIIIGAEIPSRHKRSKIKAKKKNNVEKIEKFKTNYKVFIHYDQNINSFKSIKGTLFLHIAFFKEFIHTYFFYKCYLKGYICSCLSGRKTAGCCVHVTTLILYLSCSKYREIKGPGEHLNSIFIDFNKKEQPNISRYVKNVRNKIKNSDTRNSDGVSMPKYLDMDEIENEENNSLSIQENIESTQNIIKETSLDNRNKIQALSLKEFKSHVPEWGGHIRFHENYITLSNTCTIDYYLFSLWVMNKQNMSIFEEFKSFDSNKYKLIKSITSNIEQNNWNKAKELWILKIMNYDISYIDNNDISLFGSEDLMFFQYFSKYIKNSD